ncbi:bone morphogenetic protein receptor type-2 isoform X2 [Octopus bimaculoides]|uniref:bone morphogenetic protein receptor type-2 isoform X2 n=1 Tax=Octopus bimaculoides TaxID=37653 RepID=UPI0022E86C51|nr:bone morphogenetic protein receptor type-2 isoform X2 [Octopus bimaculoides]
MLATFKWIFIVLTSIGLHIASAEEDDNHAYCAYYNDGQSSNEEKTNHDTIMPDNVTIRCSKPNDYCFSFWFISSDNSGNISLIRQDCWSYTESEKCKDECVAHLNHANVDKRNDTPMYCCCSGYRCNANFTHENKSISIPPLSPNTVPPDIDKFSENTILIIIICLFGAGSFIFILSFCIYCVYRKRQHPLPEIMEEAPSAPPGIDISNVKMLDVIAKGKYGEVWSGKLNGLPVAVKVFHHNHRQFYNNEKYIYALPFMEFDNLLKFYGADELVNSEGLHQYCIVLSYVPNGTLMNYLREHAVDWSEMCRIILSLTRGLAHLHLDITKGDKVKPAIAHRDFNSRNVLIRPNLSCVVADLGFCMATMGSKLIRNGYSESAEQSSLTDVGTVRYMAPELLDGAVNLRDCEASLKQIDVYSLGLVLWEIASRCSDLWQGVPVPEYMLPYQAEVGIHPSFEEMQILVSANKKRPWLPDMWKDSNVAIHTLKETIEDCWDHDAEARLTSFCVIERISDLSAMSPHDSRLKGVTPTLNSTSTHITVSEDAAGISAVQRNCYLATSSVTAENGNSLPTENSMAPLISQGSSGENTLNGQARNSWTPQEKSMSAVTTETMLTLSPSQSDPPPDYHSIAPHGPPLSDPPPHYENETQIGYNFSKIPNTSLVNGQPRNTWLTPDNISTAHTNTALLSSSDSDPPPKYLNINHAKTNTVIQPHQGRNPTVERNTHKRSDEELTVSGNTLISASAKREQEQKEQSLSAPTSQFHDDPFDSGPDNVESSLVHNETFNYHRNAPIQYLQNQVHSDGPLVRPKIANVPGNGVPYSKLAINEKTPKSIFKCKKPKDFTSRLTQLGKNLLSRSSQSIDGKHGRDKNSRRSTDRSGYINLIASPQQPVQTEVCLQNGSTVVLPVSNTVSSSVMTTAEQDRLGLTEMGVANTTTIHQNGHIPTGAVDAQVRNISDSSADDAPSNTKCPPAYLNKTANPVNSCNELTDMKSQRPTSLPLKVHNNPPPDSTAQLPVNQTQATSDPSEKIRNRIKTPLKINRNRLSLYDDRVMSRSCEDSVTEPSRFRLSNSSYSLQQFDTSTTNTNTANRHDLHTEQC